MYKRTTNVQYAKREMVGKSVVAKQLTAFRISPNTLKKVEALKALFATRYSEDRTPTVSAMMVSLIESRLEYFEANPDELEAELEIFRAKYETAQPTANEEPNVPENHA